MFGLVYDLIGVGGWYLAVYLTVMELCTESVDRSIINAMLIVLEESKELAVTRNQT